MAWQRENMSLFSLVLLSVILSAECLIIQGEVNNSTFTESILSSYNVTKEDVQSYSIYKFNRPEWYPARYGLDGDKSTMASTSYNANLTYWFVTLKRNYTVTAVLAMGDIGRKENMFANIEQGNISQGVFPCEKLATDWSDKMCTVSPVGGVAGDKVQLQEKGDGFFLTEAVIQALPYIDIENVKVSSYYNETIHCWQTTLNWQVADSCCSPISYTILRDGEMVTITDSIVDECVAAVENHIYTLSMSNSQMLSNVSINYTSPPIDDYLYRVDSDAISIADITYRGFSLTFPSPRVDEGMPSPHDHSVYVYRGDTTVSVHSIHCDGVLCSTDVSTLSPHANYLLRIQTDTGFARITISTWSNNVSVTTSNCSAPDPVIFRSIKQLEPKNPHVVDMKLKFQPGDPNCDGNVTYSMYFTSSTGHSIVLVCDSVLYYCSALLQGHTWYNMTIETVNAWGLASNTSMDPWLSPTKAPSKPTHLHYSLSINQTIISWSPPATPQGDITLYEVQIDYMNTSRRVVELNATQQYTLSLSDLADGSNVTVQVRAKTIFWGGYTLPLLVRRPDKSSLCADLPETSASPQLVFSQQFICANVSLINSNTSQLSPPLKLHAQISCTETSCGSTHCSTVSTRYSPVNRHSLLICGLDSNLSYTCVVSFVDIYGTQCPDEQKFTVKPIYNDDKPKAKFTGISNEKITLILIGVGGLIIVIALVLSVTLLIRRKIHLRRLSQPDDDFSLVQNEISTSSLLSNY